MRRTLGLIALFLFSTALQTAAFAETAEKDLADKQWLAFYTYRRASQTQSCTILSREAPFGILLVDRGDEQLQVIAFGRDIAPGTEAWVRIDEGRSRRFTNGIVPTDESFSVISDMLLGAYAYIEWSAPNHGIKEDQTGLGFFAWTYALCRARLGWPVPEGLKSVLSRRYDDGPDLESPEIPSAEEVYRKLEAEMEHYQRILQGLDESVDGP